MLNDASLSIIKEFEDCRLEAYLCPAGVWTIGYGRTRGVHEGMSITKADAERMLAKDLEFFERAVDNVITRPMTENQRGAFVSLAYNIGDDGFAGSTAARRFNAGDVAGAAEAMTWWNKATVSGKKVTLKGLVRRREAERALFLSDVANAVEEDVSPSADVSGGEGKPLAKSKTMGMSGAALGLGVLEQLGAVKAVLPEIEPFIPYVIGALLIGIAADRIWMRVKGVK